MVKNQRPKGTKGGKSPRECKARQKAFKPSRKKAGARALKFGKRTRALELGDHEAVLRNIQPRVGGNGPFFQWIFEITDQDGNKHEEKGFTPRGPADPKLQSWVETLLGRFPGRDEELDIYSLVGTPCMAEVVEGDRDRYQRKVADIFALEDPEEEYIDEEDEFEED